MGIEAGKRIEMCPSDMVKPGPPTKQSQLF